MNRCFAEPERWDERGVGLSTGETHHLLRVLRARPGERVEVLDGAGRRVAANVPEDASGREREDGLRLPYAEAPEQVPRACDVTLIQALPKGRRMEWILEKAVELGAARIVPVVTARTVVRLNAGERMRRETRWRRLMRQAVTQSGNPWLPRLEPIRDLPEALAGLGPLDLFLVGSLQAQAVPFRDVLGRLPSGTAGAAGVMIGPEGDLAPGEYAAAARAGAVPVNFGALTLRVETAALYALSVLVYTLGRARPGPVTESR
ncbi:MAG: 16S rRNA (uracil(1498)-N(3))-methyltransferase [Lentisphaerae bacterium]|nr:16S rRNA (uracil(1498)-N(3))-methyltransferase [Lentisphaerota bacterium]